MQRTVRYLETEIKRFKKHIGEAIKSTASLEKDYELLLTIPGIGAKTAWTMPRMPVVMLLQLGAPTLCLRK